MDEPHPCIDDLDNRHVVVTRALSESHLAIVGPVYGTDIHTGTTAYAEVVVYDQACEFVFHPFAKEFNEAAFVVRMFGFVQNRAIRRPHVPCQQMAGKGHAAHSALAAVGLGQELVELVYGFSRHTALNLLPRYS
jgi:hypothetical protein